MGLETYLQADQRTSLQDHLLGQIEAAENQPDASEMTQAAVRYFKTVTIPDEVPAELYNVLTSGTLLSITRGLLRFVSGYPAGKRIPICAPILLSGDATLWQDVLAVEASGQPNDA